MVRQTELLPEEVLVAVFHKVGGDVRLVDDQRLADTFDQAGRQSTLLRTFRRHDQYMYSERLSRALQVLDLGGSIIRENAPTKFFKVSEHTAGPYGAAMFDALGEDDKEAVSALASRLRAAFSA